MQRPEKQFAKKSLNITGTLEKDCLYSFNRCLIVY